MTNTFKSLEYKVMVAIKEAKSKESDAKEFGIRKLAEEIFGEEVSVSTVNNLLIDESVLSKSMQEKIRKGIEQWLAKEENFQFLANSGLLSLEDLKLVKSQKLKRQIISERERMENSFDGLITKIGELKSKQNKTTSANTVLGAMGGALGIAIGAAVGGPIALAIGALALAAGAGVGNHYDDLEKENSKKDEAKLAQLNNDLLGIYQAYFLEMFTLSAKYKELADENEVIKNKTLEKLKQTINELDLKSTEGNKSKDDLFVSIEKVDLITLSELLGVAKPEVIEEMANFCFKEN